MSKITLNNVADLTQATTATTTINANSAVIQTAMDNTLSRDGSTPNQMLTPLDMNGNQIINLAAPTSANSPMRLADAVGTGGTVTINNTGNLPSGGTVNQLLSKNSSTNFDAGWTSTPTFSTIVNSGNVSVPTGPETLVGRATTDTLTNKTISGASNTLNVRLANDVTGNLPVANLNSGTSASGSTFWRGDGTWGVPPSSATTFLETLALSGTTINSTVSWSGFSGIEVIFSSMAGNSVNLPAVLLHSNGSYQTTGYFPSGFSVGNGTSYANGTGAISAFLPVQNFASNGYNMGGKFRIYNLGASQFKYIVGEAAALNTGQTASFYVATSCIWTGATAVDGLQFKINSSGSYTSGVALIYGIT